MNLLPAHILHRRQIYAECKKLAALQLVIILLIVLAVYTLDYIIALHVSRAAAALPYINSERFTESEAIARDIQNHNARTTAQHITAAELGLSVFDTKRLDAVAQTLPDGVYLRSVDINEYGAILTAETKNIALSDKHRAALMDTGLISEIQLASVIITEDNTAVYTFALLWFPHE